MQVKKSKRGPDKWMKQAVGGEEGRGGGWSERGEWGRRGAVTARASEEEIITMLPSHELLSTLCLF